MRFAFGRRNVRHFVKILQSFSRITEEVRFVTTNNSLRIEAVKERTAFGVITVTSDFFDQFSTDEPIDVIFKSRSIQLVFRNAAHLSKKLTRFDVTIVPGEDCAVFRQSMQAYDRICRIPFQNQLDVAELDFGNYTHNPAQLRCPVKLLADGMRHFPSSIELVTIRIRDHNVKVETGDEEASAEYMTKFNFFRDEFQPYICREAVTVTFSLRLLKQFLSAWDKKTHDIDSFFREKSGIVFVVESFGLKTQLMLACVTKDHRANSPIPTGDETILSTNVTYMTNTRSNNTLTTVNQSMADVSIANASLTHQQDNRSTHSVPQPMQTDDDEYLFDDSLDEVISAVPDPVANTSAPSHADAGDGNGNASEFSGFEIRTQRISQPLNQSTQQTFDPQAYRDVLDTSLFRTSRIICGFDETLVSSRDLSAGDEDSEEDDFIFDY